MAKNKIITTIFLGILIATSFGVAAYAGPASFMLASSKRIVNTGSTFGIPVKVFPNGASIDTARVILSFDPHVLMATEFKFSSDLNTQAPASFIDNQKGIISWGGFDMQYRIQSPTVFGLATFKAISQGDGQIALTSSSKLISGGEDVSNPSLYNAVDISVVTPSPPKAEAKVSANTDLPPEYHYRLVPSSFLCRPLPSLCRTKLGESLVSIILLFIVILILVLVRFYRRPNV